MTLDQALVRSVNHHIIGNAIGFVSSLHSEAEVDGNLAELQQDIGAGRDRCISACEAMLSNPAEYAKKPDYQLKPEDRVFLQGLLDKAREVDWMDPAKVRELSDYATNYVPENPIEGI